METTYTKTDFINHLNLLKPSGYILNNDLFFEKSIPNGKISISCRGNEYFPHSFIFGSVSVDVRFTNVEDIFSQVCLTTNNLVYEADADDYTFGLGFADDVIGETNFDFLYDNEVYNDETFFRVRPLLQQMINSALQWVSQNETIQNAYNNAELLSLDARSDLYSHPFPAKYMIVKKLVGASDYSSYATENVNFYNSESDTAKANFYQILKTTLDAL